MSALEWLTPKEAAAESGRDPYNVREALRRRLLIGSQSRPGACWRIRRRDLDDWIERGAPLDHPARRRLRRSA